MSKLEKIVAIAAVSLIASTAVAAEETYQKYTYEVKNVEEPMPRLPGWYRPLSTFKITSNKSFEWRHYPDRKNERYYNAAFLVCNHITSPLPFYVAEDNYQDPVLKVYVDSKPTDKLTEKTIYVIPRKSQQGYSYPDYPGPEEYIPECPKKN